MTDAQAPMGAPGCIINWPMLKIHYRTDPEAIARTFTSGHHSWQRAQRESDGLQLPST